MANSRNVGRDSKDRIPTLINKLIEKCKKSVFVATPDCLLNNDVMAKEFNDYINTLKQHNIVEVDNKFKSVSSASVKNSYVFTVDRYHPELGSIKIAELKHISGIGPAEYMITFNNHKENTKKYYYVREDYKSHIAKLIKKIQKQIPEHETEIMTPKQRRLSISPHSSSYWSHQALNWDSPTSQTRYHYENVSDPTILEMFEKYILPRSKIHQPLVIADVGGGKGRVAAKLINLMQKNGIQFKYLLVEPDADQAKEAESVLSELKASYGNDFKGEIEVIQSTLQDFEQSDHYTRYAGNVHGIVLSGGPINEEVVSYAEGRKNLTIVENLLSSEGRFIATGLTNTLFTKKDFLNDNLRVLNVAKKLRVKSFFGPKENKLIQCYVCEKPNSDEPSISNLNITNPKAKK